MLAIFIMNQFVRRPGDRELGIPQSSEPHSRAWNYPRPDALASVACLAYEQDARINTGTTAQVIGKTLKSYQEDHTFQVNRSSPMFRDLSNPGTEATHL
jgi:hypothetical protein